MCIRDSPLGTPSGDLSNIYDGNWSSSTTLNDNSQLYYYVNYTKPDNVTNTSKLEYKSGQKRENLTIPEGCWNYDENNLYFLVVVLDYISDYTKIYAYDGDYDQEITSSDTSPVFYEERMNWNSGEGDNWTLVQTNSSESPNTKIYREFANANNYSTIYWWKVNIAVSYTHLTLPTN